MKIKEWLNRYPRLSMLAASLVFGGIAHLIFYSFSLNDPDRYFHFAFARDLGAGLYLDKIANFPYLGWDKEFIDKEPLYHFLISKLHLVGGETAIYLFHLALLIGIVFLLMSIALVFVPSVEAAFVVLGFVWLSAFVFPRMIYIRPHNLAILLFAALILSLLRKFKWGAFVSGLLFVLSYHLFVLPLGVLTLFQICYRIGHKQYDTAAWFGMGGIVLGTLLNPYFPGNILLSLFIVNIGFNASTGNLPVGLELEPHHPVKFLQYYCHYFFLILVTSIPIIRKKKLQSFLASGSGILVVLALCMFPALILSPRIEEYLFVIVAPMAGIAFQQIRQREGFFLEIRNIFLFMMLLGVVAFSSSRDHYHKWAKGESARAEANYIIRSMKSIENKDEIDTIFHCNWATGAYIYYAFPKSKAVDVLDPTFLFAFQPELYHSRARMMQGWDGNIWATVAKKFKASHFGCVVYNELEQIARNPNFVRVYPKSRDQMESGRSSNFFLYRMAEYSHSAFDIDIEYKQVSRKLSEALLKKFEISSIDLKNDWKLPLDFQDGKDSELRILGSEIHFPHVNKDRELCYLFRFPVRRLESKEGAWIGIGGNAGRILFTSEKVLALVEATLAINRQIGGFLALEENAVSKPFLYSFACANRRHPDLVQTLTFSFWRESELRQQCESKILKNTSSILSCFPSQNISIQVPAL